MYIWRGASIVFLVLSCTNDATVRRRVDIILKREDTNEIAVKESLVGKSRGEHAYRLALGGFYMQCPEIYAQRYLGGVGGDAGRDNLHRVQLGECKLLRPYAFEAVDVGANACVYSKERKRFGDTLLEAGEAAMITNTFDFEFDGVLTGSSWGNKNKNRSWVDYFAAKGASRKGVIALSKYAKRLTASSMAQSGSGSGTPASDLSGRRVPELIYRLKRDPRPQHTWVYTVSLDSSDKMDADIISAAKDKFVWLDCEAAMDESSNFHAALVKFAGGCESKEGGIPQKRRKLRSPSLRNIARSRENFLEIEKEAYGKGKRGEESRRDWKQGELSKERGLDEKRKKKDDTKEKKRETEAVRVVRRLAKSQLSTQN